ncbi:hypothetical protein [Paenibacillus cymbidii]|uniref:hypothetical protein n=1 Tax=Paenibacillus cymbidii TaxID=1639034 RepID=UPI001081F97A|nr:hypothetical protein [Paenibacillus cymbidii]
MPAGIEREAWNAPRETHEMYVAHFHYAGDGEGVRLLGAERACAARPPSGDYVRNRFAALTQYWLRQSAGRPALCHAALLELLALLGEAAEADSLQGVTSSLVYRLANSLTSTRCSATLPAARRRLTCATRWSGSCRLSPGAQRSIRLPTRGRKRAAIEPIDCGGWRGMPGSKR